MEIDKKQVGRRIQLARKKKGMTLEEFGKLFEAGKSNVSKWEKGSSLPNSERLVQIAKVADVSLDELLYGSVWEYAKKVIDEICAKYNISDSYFYTIYDEELHSLFDTEDTSLPPKQVFVYLFIDSLEDSNMLTYVFIESQEFESAFLRTIGFDKSLRDTSLRGKVMQYVNEITTIEIQEFNYNKYKILYNPSMKEKAVNFMLRKYSFGSLSDIGIKERTRELLEIFLDREIEMRFYTSPFSNEYAIKYIRRMFIEKTKKQFEDYFMKEDLPLISRDTLKEDEIKSELSYKLYLEMLGIFENTYDEFNQILEKYSDN